LGYLKQAADIIAKEDLNSTMKGEPSRFISASEQLQLKKVWK
jgi:hypothetical protein